MANRAPFLKTRYGGYFHREVPGEDAARHRLMARLTDRTLSRRFRRAAGPSPFLRPALPAQQAAAPAPAAGRRVRPGSNRCWLTDGGMHP